MCLNSKIISSMNVTFHKRMHSPMSLSMMARITQFPSFIFKIENSCRTTNIPLTTTKIYAKQSQKNRTNKEINTTHLWLGSKLFALRCSKSKPNHFDYDLSTWTILSGQRRGIQKLIKNAKYFKLAYHKLLLKLFILSKLAPQTITIDSKKVLQTSPKTVITHIPDFFHSL